MKRLTIAFRSDPPNDDLRHHAFWFAESLYHPIVSAGLGTLSDIDRMAYVFWIEVKNNHNMGKVKQIVRRGLAKHRLAADAIVTVDSVPQKSSKIPD